MSKENFISDLHLACSKDDIRPAMQCVHFINGYAYASDSIILIKQSLEYNNQILGYHLLDCKSIHMDSFKEIRKYERVEVSDEGFECIAKNGRKAFFPFTEFDEDITIPDFDAVIPSGITHVGEIGIHPKYVGILEKALAGNRPLKATFTGVDRGILFRSLDENYPDQLALLMPERISED